MSQPPNNDGKKRTFVMVTPLHLEVLNAPDTRGAHSIETVEVAHVAHAVPRNVFLLFSSGLLTRKALASSKLTMSDDDLDRITDGVSVKHLAVKPAHPRAHARQSKGDTHDGSPRNSPRYGQANLCLCLSL
jgi:hypothetical protein